MNKIVLKSPGKINLGLRILGRTQEEYHLLQSLFLPIELYDLITLEDGKNSLDSENTISKALSLLKKDCSVTLNKKIPIGAGLGGGSSNAGTLLKYFKNEFSEDTLKSFALKIGADVPFFLNPAPSWVEGIGETITPLKNTPALTICLVVFPFQCLTKTVFDEYRNQKKPFSQRLTFTNFEDYLSNANNDLEEAACKLFPQIGDVLDRLRKVPSLYCGMSGSGATCYLLFQDSLAEEKYSKVILDYCRMYDCHTVWTKSFSDKA
jgi:4-diphosphocytidyl-2-C-methyl-D-erythritol kinase